MGKRDVDGSNLGLIFKNPKLTAEIETPTHNATGFDNSHPKPNSIINSKLEHKSENQSKTIISVYHISKYIKLKLKEFKM